MASSNKNFSELTPLEILQCKINQIQDESLESTERILNDLEEADHASKSTLGKKKKILNTKV